MNLKNPELFRSWLIRQLEPICKANPEPVSKYVCALLKKEKSDGELKQSLISQLDIFLDSATEEFVNFLIDVLENEKYLLDGVSFRSAESEKLLLDDDTLNLSVEPESEPPVEKEKPQRKSPSPIQAPTPSPPRKVPFQKSYSPRPRRSRFRNERRRIAPRRSRREASSHSDSPASERRPLTRKRSASGSSESSTKSPRRSWIASRPSDVKKYKHRHFTRSSPVGQRSRSTSPKLRKRKAANGNFRKRPIPNSRSNSDDERNHVVSKRVPTYPNDLPPIDLPPSKPDLPPIEPGFGQKQRCIDFEGKGYCARGDMCPFDHGPSPIVLDNNLLNGIVPLPPPPVHNTAFQDTNLYTPQYVNTTFPPANTKPFRSENMAPVTTRELISVPTIPLPQKPKNVHAGKPSYGHIFSSLPPGVSQTTIELTNVPADLNNIPSLYDNFSTFGNLTLIQAKRNGDASTAMLTFSNATEAALAFINVDQAIPAAKAAWYADKCILKPFPRKSIPASGQANAKSYVLNRKIPVTAPAPSSEPSKPPIKIPTPAPPKSEPSKPAMTNDDKEKANEVSRQDPGRLLSDLIKKKRDLLEKQLASRKEIVEKMKTLEIGSKDEKTWQDVLKKLNDVIAENEKSIKISLQKRKEYLQKMNIVPMDSAALNILRQEEKNQARMTPMEAAANPAANAGAKPEKTEGSELDVDEQIDDSIFEIDCDLSILNQELDDDDDDENESPSKVSSQAADTSTKTDENKSPSSGPIEYTRVVVSGFENGDEDELLQHFSRFGTILDKEFDNTIPSATLIYDNRKSAEDAKKSGRNFQDRLLSVTVFSAKKFQPIVRRVVAFKPQYEKEYNPYAQYSGNPYKYKNPQMSQTPVQRTVTRNVYSYRAEPKNRTANVTTSQTPPKPAVENNELRTNDDEEFGEVDSTEFGKETE